MDYRIAIPTIKRSETIRKKTLNYLLKTDIDLSKIDIFFSDPSEIPLYKKNLSDLPIQNYIPTDMRHVRLQRNFICNYYKPNQFIVGIDDDIISLEYKINDKMTKPLLKLNEFIKKAFEFSQKNYSDLWGISAVNNPYFMKKNISFNLKYIVGCFYGWKNTTQPKNFLSTEKGKDGHLFGKEDYEKSIQYYLADGKVTRFNYVAPNTKYYSEDGGIQTYRTIENEGNGVKYLLKKYPLLCKRKIVKDGKYPEIRLIDQRKTLSK